MRLPAPVPAPTPVSLAQDALSQVLDILRLKGRSVHNVSLRHPLVAHQPASGPCLYVVREGAVGFTTSGDPEVTAQMGDVVLFAHGAPHTLACSTGHSAASALRGDFDYDGGFAARFLGPLPALIRLPSPTSGPYAWVQIGCGLILEEVAQEQAGGTAMISRILDLLFVRTLRSWAAQDHRQTGWLAGAMDARIGRALAAMHQEPQREWSIDALAALGPMSRTAFAELFARVLGETPMSYLAGWRLDCAAKLLLGTASVAQVASSVGYASESAFSRAFKARHGCSPLAYREAHRAVANDALGL